MAMVPDAVAGFHHDQIEPKRQSGDGRAIGKRATVQQAIGGGTDAYPLAVVDRLLRQAELAACPPADLDDHEGGRRTRVDRHEIELVATDMHVPGKDGPTGVREAHRDQRLGGVTRLLRQRSRRVVGSVRHPVMVAAGA